MLTGMHVKDQVVDTDGTSRRAFMIHCEAIPYILATTDAIIIIASGMLGSLIYHWAIGMTQPGLTIYVGVGMLAAFIHILRLSGSGYYDFESSAKPHVELVDITLSWVTTALLLAFFAFLLKIGMVLSRGAIVVAFISAYVGLLGGRKGTKALLALAVARGAIGRSNIALIGVAEEITALEPGDLLALFGAGDVTQFQLSDATDEQERRLHDNQMFERVAAFIKSHNSSEILLAVPWGDEPRIEFLREKLKLLPIAARLLPDNRVRALTNYSSSVQQHVLSIEIQGAPLNGWERATKRIMDVVVAGCALIFFSPIMLMTALAIKLDGPGPVFFRQRRKGFNGQEFVMYKFRTMTVQEDGTNVVQATRDDPRVTNIGRHLRAASIDELPQLFNVLRGEMSVIGPRPHAIAHDTYFENILSDYAFRHHVKPGITGWAQCNGARGATPTVDAIARRVRLDLWYINNWSIFLDVRILMKTFFEVIRRRNAF